MTELTVVLDSIDLRAFYGLNNANILLVKSLYPKLKLVVRGNTVQVMGSADQTAEFERAFQRIIRHFEEFNSLSEEVIVDFIKGGSVSTAKPNNLILFGVNGKPITPRSENQQRLVEAYHDNDLLFALGPAGSGKTYLAIALAVRALKNKEVKKIILSRPAVEAGEKLGFLPGDMKEKIDPYLQPLYDALQDMIPVPKLKDYIDNNIIQIAPLAFMRGRTLSDAVIILDEAQNTTIHQIKMFLTRLGLNAKMIITGDMTQIDLPSSQRSGLIHALSVLSKVKGIGSVEFEKSDIVRHSLVQRIVDAYEKHETKEKRTTNQ